MRSFEPAFRRIRAEHRVLRALLTAAEGDIDRARGRRLARHLAFIEDHADYEDDVLYPFVAARVPSVARAVAHAEEEHGWIAEELPGLLAALRSGQRYSGPLVEGLRHHFAEEEADIWAPALAAGLTVTHEGTVGHLAELHEEVMALGGDRGSGNRPTSDHARRASNPSQGRSRVAYPLDHQLHACSSRVG